jgi:ThiF family
LSQPWFERWPDLKAFEEERFEACDLPWREDSGLLEHGYLAVDTEVQFKGAPLEIKVIYPSEYPELPPHVHSELAVLTRHQQPFSGNFCLLQHPIDSWTPGSWGAADLIDVQLRKLLADSEADEGTVRENEAPMPEPVTAHFRYEQDAVVVVPGELAAPAGDSGDFEIAAFDGNRYLLRRVGDAEVNEHLAEPFPCQQKLLGRWKRLDQLPLPDIGPTGQEVRVWLESEHPDLFPAKPPPPPPKKRRKRSKPRGDLHVIGLVLSEEREADGETKDSWMFLAVRDKQANLLHAQELSEHERLRRIPDLAGLGAKKAVVIGLGSLGGDVALHLARANVGKIVLADFDRMEVNNSVRHALGTEWAGINKASALAGSCRRMNPFCSVEPILLHLGEIHPQRTPLEVLEELIADADVVVETTGVHQIEHLVGRVAWDLGKPMVSCWVTNGSWAGEVVRLAPGETMCMTCFQGGQREGTLLVGDADPVEAPVAVQGCSHPTVSGAGFDAAETATMAARLAIQSILNGDDYQAPDWDHAVANFRRSPEDNELARFEAESLPPNENCSACSPGAG